MEMEFHSNKVKAFLNFYHKSCLPKLMFPFNRFWLYIGKVTKSDLSLSQVSGKTKLIVGKVLLWY